MALSSPKLVKRFYDTDRLGTAPHVRGRDGDCSPPTGSPEAVAHLRFPQNVACGFTAPRSSAVDSQHCERLQLPVREAQFGWQ